MSIKDKGVVAEGQRVHANGIDIHYLDRGEGEPLVRPGGAERQAPEQIGQPGGHPSSAGEPQGGPQHVVDRDEEDADAEKPYEDTQRRRPLPSGEAGSTARATYTLLPFNSARG